MMREGFPWFFYEYLLANKPKAGDFKNVIYASAYAAYLARTYPQLSLDEDIPNLISMLLDIDGHCSEIYQFIWLPADEVLEKEFGISELNYDEVDDFYNSDAFVEYQSRKNKIYSVIFEEMIENRNKVKNKFTGDIRKFVVKLAQMIEFQEE